MKAPKLVSSTLPGRTRQAKLCGVALGAAILVAFCGGPLRAAMDGGNNPGILPPDSTPGDLSYPQWHLSWWDWAMSMPQAGHPLLNADDLGDQATSINPVWVGPYDASAGQSGRVWFLAETFANGWTVQRDAVIPAGTALFFPLQNHAVYGWPPIPEAEAWFRSYLDLLFSTAVVTCEIDGVPIQNLERFLVQSPALPLVLDENNFLDSPAGYHGTIVDEGYYLFLAPLSVGTHTIHWTATLELIPAWNPWDPAPTPPYPQGNQDVTYHITVVPSQ